MSVNEIKFDPHFMDNLDRGLRREEELQLIIDKISKAYLRVREKKVRVDITLPHEKITAYPLLAQGLIRIDIRKR